MYKGLVMQIAIVDRHSEKWSAGGTFTEMVVRSLREAGGDGVEITVLTPDKSRWEGLARTVEVSKTNKAGGRKFKKMFGKMELTPEESYCESEGISAMFLATNFSPAKTKVKRVAWIFDFQHKHLPELFTKKELATRDRMFRKWACQADSVMLSSQSSFDDFKTFLPEFEEKGVVARFPSLYAFLPLGEITISLEKYGLPKKFALVANQYWSHKNHSAVIRAVSLLNKQGIRIPVVFTGLPLDSRDPCNASVSKMLQEIASLNLAGQVIPLGLVSKGDLTDLMRLAAVVIQPSRFEGWSTVVQDALALGRPLICSDIPVHREQAPNALGFFECDDPDALTDILERVWDDITPGPDPEQEVLGVSEQKKNAAIHGDILLDLCGC